MKQVFGFRSCLSAGRKAAAHDGRFPTVMAVIERYDRFRELGLSDAEKHDLTEYLESL